MISLEQQKQQSKQASWVLFYDGGPAKFIPRFYAVLIGTQSL